MTNFHREIIAIKREKIAEMEKALLKALDALKKLNNVGGNNEREKWVRKISKEAIDSLRKVVGR